MTTRSEDTSFSAIRRLPRFKIITAVSSVLLLLLVGSVYAFRFELWRKHAGLRSIVRPFLLVDPTLRRAEKPDVRKLLGEPTVVQGRYCWFPRDLHQMTGDLKFEIDSSNQVSRLHFIWRDWTPSKVMPMNLASWEDQTESDRWAMNADLVQRWPTGEFRESLRTVHDVLKHFPGAVFIDHWQYASDGAYGLGGSLDFAFEPDGRIRKVRSGYID